jgi:hypothetical protein
MSDQWYQLDIPQLREAPRLTLLLITENNTHEAAVMQQVMKGTIQILGATYRVLSFAPVAKLDYHTAIVEITIQQEISTR